MDLEDTVAAQRDYIRELHKDIEQLRQRLHDCNEYALQLKYQLDELHG